ncbi:MAG: phospholipid carrier-dependent glycosyltransferase [PVC group bacterium]
MNSSPKIAWSIVLIILFAHVCFQYYLLLDVANGRYTYHVDNAWRALSAYKWSKSPFITYNPVRFPLEFALYGTVLKFWHDIPLALATVTIAFSTGIVFLIFLLTRFLFKDDRGAIVASLFAAFIPSALLGSIGCMSEIIMCFWILGGIYFYLRFEGALFSPESKPSWGRLYASSIFFLLASAQRAEGWGFVICYLALLIILYWKMRKQTGIPLSPLTFHLLICAVISVIFIPFYMIYAHQRAGQALRFVDHYLSDFARQGEVAPRLLVYPLHLFRLEPLLVLLGILGILCIFKVKKTLLIKYLLFLGLAFTGYELSDLIVGADVAPTRAMFIVAFLLCPLTGLSWHRLWSKQKPLGYLLLVIILINTGFNISKAIPPVRDYTHWEGDIDILGKYLKRMDSSLSPGENILVELGDRWAVPSEYYLFYYVPERLTFDKGGAWCPAWKKVLFTRNFRETYLGFPEKMREGDTDSLFDKPEAELEQVLRNGRVSFVVTTSEAGTRKMSKLCRRQEKIGRYTVFIPDQS